MVFFVRIVQVRFLISLHGTLELRILACPPFQYTYRIPYTGKVVMNSMICVVCKYVDSYCDNDIGQSHATQGNRSFLVSNNSNNM